MQDPVLIANHGLMKQSFDNLLFRGCGGRHRACREEGDHLPSGTTPVILVAATAGRHNRGVWEEPGNDRTCGGTRAKGALSSTLRVVTEWVLKVEGTGWREYF